LPVAAFGVVVHPATKAATLGSACVVNAS
jgi:hypothetical protein